MKIKSPRHTKYQLWSFTKGKFIRIHSRLICLGFQFPKIERSHQPLRPVSRLISFKTLKTARHSGMQIKLQTCLKLKDISSFSHFILISYLFFQLALQSRVIFSTMLDCWHAQRRPQAKSNANSIIVSPSECKLFL